MAEDLREDADDITALKRENAELRAALSECHEQIRALMNFSLCAIRQIVRCARQLATIFSQQQEIIGLLQNQKIVESRTEEEEQ